MEKARKFEKSICFTNYAKAFDCVDHNKLWKILKKMVYQTTWTASWKACMQVKKQQLEPDMEKWTGSKLGKEYIKVIYCHLAYLTYMQSESEKRSVETDSVTPWTIYTPCNSPGQNTEWVVFPFSRGSSQPKY